MLSPFESPSTMTSELKTRSSLREQLRKLRMGSILLLSSYLSGCCPTGCNQSNHRPDTSSPDVDLIALYTTDAGPRDARTTVPPPPRGGSTATVGDAGADADVTVDAAIADAGAVDANVVVDGAADVALTDADVVDSDVTDAGAADGSADAGAVITIPTIQGTPAEIAERDRCYRELPSHACLRDQSIPAVGDAGVRTLHTMQINPQLSEENHLVPYDRTPANDLACEFVDRSGQRTFVMAFQHGDAYYTCDYHDRAATDLRFHRLVPCTSRVITASTPNPCTRR
jgi:hypothetical protein